MIGNSSTTTTVLLPWCVLPYSQLRRGYTTD